MYTSMSGEGKVSATCLYDKGRSPVCLHECVG